MNDNKDDIEILQEEIEKTLKEDAELLRQHQKTIDAFAEYPEEVDPHEDQFLKIEDALCLPEMGGKKFVHGLAITSDTMTEGMVREAIRKGELAAFRPNKNLFVTRRYLKEWMTACRVDVDNPTSNSNLSVATRTAPSSKPSGLSDTSAKRRDDRLAKAQSAALAKVMRLKKSLRNG